MLSTRRVGKGLLLTGALVMAAGAGAVLSRGTLSMSKGFEKAIIASGSELSFDRRVEPHRVGDEGYWLTRAEVESPALFAKPVAIGDRITISGTDGVERKLQVVDVKAIGSLLPAQSQAEAASLLLVTARVLGIADDKAKVRFVVEGQIAKPPAADTAKTL